MAYHALLGSCPTSKLNYGMKTIYVSTDYSSHFLYLKGEKNSPKYAVQVGWVCNYAFFF